MLVVGSQAMLCSAGQGSGGELAAAVAALGVPTYCAGDGRGAVMCRCCSFLLMPCRRRVVARIERMVGVTTLEPSVKIIRLPCLP